MKKIISMILAFALIIGACFALASCDVLDSIMGMFGGESSAAEVVKVIDYALSEEVYAFCVNNADTELKDATNAFLKKIQENGKFDEICNNYFGDGTPLKFNSATLDPSKDQLVVATSTGFAPFEMVDPDGKFYGIDLEIAYYLAEELGKELETGTCDIGMAGLSVTPAREAVVTFTNTYYNASQVLIVKATDTTFDECKSGEDVAAILASLTSESKIGCQKGTTGELYIDGDEDYGFPGLAATKMSYDYAALAVNAMVNGNIDFVIVDNGPAKAISASVNGK